MPFFEREGVFHVFYEYISFDFFCFRKSENMLLFSDMLFLRGSLISKTKGQVHIALVYSSDATHTPSEPDEPVRNRMLNPPLTSLEPNKTNSKPRKAKKARNHNKKHKKR